MMERTGLPPQLKSGCAMYLAGRTANVASTLVDKPLYSDSRLVRFFSMESLAGKDGFDLTNSGCSQVVGKFGNAYSTGANNDANGMYNTTDVGINGGAVTVCAWIKTLSSHKGNNPYNFGIWESSPTSHVINGITFNKNNTSVSFARLRSIIEWQGPTVGFNATPGTWNHYAMTFDGRTIRGYINGTLVGTAGGGGGGSVDPNRAYGVGLGNNVTITNVDASSVAVDEFAVFNAALSGAEILEIAGYSVCLDLSGNGNHGILVNSPAPKRRHGYDGFEFNGSNQYVEIADDATLNFGTGDFTACVTVNLATVSSEQIFIGKMNTAGTGIQKGWNAGLINNGGITHLFQTFDNAATVTWGPSNDLKGLVPGKTTRMAYVRRGTALEIWMDGLLIATSSGTVRNVDNPYTLSIGRYDWANLFFTNGVVTNPYLANVALSEEAIMLDALTHFIP